MDFICVVCGETAPDTDHVVIDVTYKRMWDRNDVDEYDLHDRCAFNTIDSGEEPY